MTTNGSGRNVLIAGATSAIALECARLFAAEGARLALIARNPSRLEALADDLRVRGAAEVATLVADLTDLPKHEEILALAGSLPGGLDLALVAHGSLAEQGRCETDAGLVARELATNAVSTICLVTRIAAAMEPRRHGCIAVISSVAGDRGRRSNYVYGSAKAAVSTFLSGLRSRLHHAGVSVVTIKPGFIDTPMTAHLPKNVLFASAATAGRAVHDAMLSPRDEVYVPWFWRWIMLVVRHIPAPLFKRLSF